MSEVHVVRDSSFGGKFGTGLGSGLGEGINNLLESKLSSMKQQNQQRQLAQTYRSLGIPEQVAYLPQELQSLYVKDILSAPGEQAYAQGLNALLGGQQQELEPSMESSLQGQTPAQIPENLQQLLQQLSPSQQAFPQIGEFQKPQAAPQQTAAPAQQQVSQKDQAKIPARLNQQQATKLAELGLKREEIGKKRESEQFKITKDDRKEILEKSRAARQTLRDLDRMEELEKSGKLDTPGYVEFLHRSGLDIPALLNPQSEEFQKITGNFLRDAKTYFGNRVTQYEVQQFLKLIPSLSQSPEGRKRVISNLKYMANGALEYNKALKEVLSENKGIPPYDLLEQIDNKVENRLDVLSEKFKKDLDKPVPAGQNKLITALQAGLGSVVGAPGKLLGSAGGALKGLGSLGDLGELAV